MLKPFVLMPLLFNSEHTEGFDQVQLSTSGIAPVSSKDGVLVRAGGITCCRRHFVQMQDLSIRE